MEVETYTTFKPELDMSEQWIKCSERLPKDEQRVWVIDQGGYEYPAWFFVNANMERYFASARESITFNFVPKMWRPRE